MQPGTKCVKNILWGRILLEGMCKNQKPAKMNSTIIVSVDNTDHHIKPFLSCTCYPTPGSRKRFDTSHVQRGGLRRSRRDGANTGHVRRYQRRQGSIWLIVRLAGQLCYRVHRCGPLINQSQHLSSSCNAPLVTPLLFWYVGISAILMWYLSTLSDLSTLGCVVSASRLSSEGTKWA